MPDNFNIHDFLSKFNKEKPSTSTEEKQLSPKLNSEDLSETIDYFSELYVALKCATDNNDFAKEFTLSLFRVSLLQTMLGEMIKLLVK